MSKDCTQPAPEPTDSLTVVTMLAEISRAEQHFNVLETEYRKLASTWLLAAFGAMGYIMTAKGLPVPSGPTLFGIAVAASIGIQLLWMVDLLTYHQLLLANFLEGWRLEKMHGFLPKVRINMLTQGTVGKRVRLFYFGSSLSPLVFGVAAYFFINHPTFDAMPDVVVVVFAAVLAVTSTTLMRKSAGMWVRAEIARLNKEFEVDVRRNEFVKS